MKKILSVLFFLLFIVILSYSQEDIYEEMLTEEVEVANPVYKPIVGFGAGIMSYWGDVKDDYSNPMGGRMAAKINISTYIDNKRILRANFFLLSGKMTGNERSLESNLNFLTDVISFGVNINYGFGNFFKGIKRIRPFISAGFETIQFNSKGDLFDGNGLRYFYWSDGTIRNLSETSSNMIGSVILQRDYQYETDLRKSVNETYPQNAFAIPVDFGLDFSISERVTMRVGSSMHLAFSDWIDNVNSTATQKKDLFSFSYVTLHLDLFSDAKTLIVEHLFAEIDDYALYEDEDGDYIPDGRDECPDTPPQILDVDSVGCPFDDDDDGVANYFDKEKNSRTNVFVNDEGVELSEEELIAMFSNVDAVERNEVDLYVNNILGFSSYDGQTNLQIPDKFKHLDINKDNYISFDELLKAIDSFFDYKSSLTTEDIYELNNFFFHQ